MGEVAGLRVWGVTYPNFRGQVTGTRGYYDPRAGWQAREPQGFHSECPSPCDEALPDLRALQGVTRQP